MQDWESIANDLRIHGVVTVPVLSDHSIWAGHIWEAIDEFPEYKVQGRNAQRVLGGFGAFGNPSSFHHPTVRSLRSSLRRSLLPLFTAYAAVAGLHSAHLETLIDRLCVRCRDFGNVSSESWHRDIYSGSRDLPESDVIFGGWANLSNDVQRFVCLLGSHNDARDNSSGFAVLSPEDIKKHALRERLLAQANKHYGSVKTNAHGHITIPPGHVVIFFQHILHTVLGGKQPIVPQLRLFCGYRLTHDTCPLFNYDTTNMSVPYLPSGQMPPMYSQNHYMFFSKSAKYREWGQKTFRPQCLFARTTKDGTMYHTPGCFNDTGCFNKQRTMSSLAQMGLSLEPYTSDDISILRPQPLNF